MKAMGYRKPNAEMVRFLNEDIIATSPGDFNQVRWDKANGNHITGSDDVNSYYKAKQEHQRPNGEGWSDPVQWDDGGTTWWVWWKKK